MTTLPALPLPSNLVCHCSGTPHARGIARCVWSPHTVPPGHAFPCDTDWCRRCAHIASA